MYIYRDKKIINLKNVALIQCEEIKQEYLIRFYYNLCNRDGIPQHEDFKFRDEQDRDFAFLSLLQSIGNKNSRLFFMEDLHLHPHRHLNRESEN